MMATVRHTSAEPDRLVELAGNFLTKPNERVCARCNTSRSNWASPQATELQSRKVANVLIVESRKSSTCVSHQSDRVGILEMCFSADETWFGSESTTRK